MSHTYRDENGDPIDVSLYKLINNMDNDMNHKDWIQMMKNLHYRLKSVEERLEAIERCPAVENDLP